MYEIEKIDTKQLEALETTYALLERLLELEKLPKLYILGILDSKFNYEIEALYTEYLKDFADVETDEELNQIKSPKISKVAVSIPVSSDVLYYLNSSGVLIGNERVAILHDNNVAESNLNLRNLGKIRIEDLSDTVITEDPEAVDSYLSQYKAATKTSDVHNSRIVKILDESGNTWDDMDPESTREIMEQVESADKSHEFVSVAEGNMSRFFIEVKHGPEAAIRYIANEMETDYDDVKNFPSFMVMSQPEAVNFMHEIFDSIV